MKSNNGESITLATDLQKSQNQKQNISSTQRRMLTKSEIELLQKNKKESMEKMIAIFKAKNVIRKISAKRTEAD